MAPPASFFACSFARWRRATNLSFFLCNHYLYFLVVKVIKRNTKSHELHENYRLKRVEKFEQITSALVSTEERETRTEPKFVRIQAGTDCRKNHIFPRTIASFHLFLSLSPLPPPDRSSTVEEPDLFNDVLNMPSFRGKSGDEMVGRYDDLRRL